MNHTIKSSDNYDIYIQSDLIDNPKAMLILNHGFVEYGAHYNGFSKTMNDMGYSVIRYDHRGHGRTSAPLGHIESFHDYVDDLNRVIGYVKEIDSTAPIVLVGFSLGGSIAMMYAVSNPHSIEGLILLGALSKPQDQFRDVNATISIQEFLRRMGTDGDKGIQQLVSMQSPYVLKEATSSFVHQALIEGIEFANTFSSRIVCPTLIIHGRKDPIIPVSWSEELKLRLENSDVTMEVIEEGYHDLLRNKNGTGVMTMMDAWIGESIL